MKTQIENTKYLLHQLQIHQIELEMQNEELKRINQELEVSLKKYSGLYNFAPIGFFIINEKGRILKDNSAGKILLGTDGHLMRNSQFLNCIDKDSLSVFNAFSKKVFLSETKHNCELVLLRIDGSRIHTYVDGVAIQNEEGNGKQMLLSITDVTNFRMIENELTESRMLDKIKTEFFSNISHELRTPLNVIFASLQLIELYKGSDSSAKSILNLDKHHYIIKQNSRRLLRLVNNLIDSTRIDSGFYKPLFLNNDIVRVVKSITTSVMQFVESKSISLELVSDIEEKIIRCDVDLIERVVLNILSNAVKFTKSGGRIAVNITEKDESIVMSIKDNGIGIPKDKQKVIFQRFKQVDNGLIREYEGSGIGLNLAKSIVEMHGGTISVESVFGEGSEFIIKLPNRVLKQENISLDKKYEDREKSQVERINIEFSDIYM
ncbi:MAG TPA: PAS domain-containing sensor histidine kinase [Ruminiclostridium sp.]